MEQDGCYLAESFAAPLPRSLDVSPVDRVDTLAHELALLNSQAKRSIAMLGSRHVAMTTSHLVELLASALAREGHSLFTSGALGTNAAVIRGVLAVKPSALTVVLPQSLSRQNRESRQLMEGMLHLIEKPEHDHLPLQEASRLCNKEIIERCDQLICMVFHDSHTLLETAQMAEDQCRLVSVLYFD